VISGAIAVNTRVHFLPPLRTRGCGCTGRPAFPAPSDRRGRNEQTKPRAKQAARSQICALFEIRICALRFVVPANAGTHNHRKRLLREGSRTAFSYHTRHGVWVPAFAGTTSHGDAGVGKGALRAALLAISLKAQPAAISERISARSSSISLRPLLVSTCQKVQPLQAPEPCATAPMRWIEPTLSPSMMAPSARTKAP
jgi:hypothetical protein